MPTTEPCLLGTKNATKIEDLERRVELFERRKSGNGNGVIRYIGLVLAIVTAMFGATKWVGRDVDVLRQTVIKNSVHAEKHFAEDGHPAFQTGAFAEIKNRTERIEKRIESQITALDVKLQIEVAQVESNSALRTARDEARLTKLEEWQRWWYRNQMAGEEKLKRFE